VYGENSAAAATVLATRIEGVSQSEVEDRLGCKGHQKGIPSFIWEGAEVWAFGGLLGDMVEKSKMLLMHCHDLSELSFFKIK
jgi:hypothetical protein